MGRMGRAKSKETIFLPFVSFWQIGKYIKQNPLHSDEHAPPDRHMVFKELAVLI
jgi:hypothetical protein